MYIHFYLYIQWHLLQGNFQLFLLGYGNKKSLHSHITIQHKNAGVKHQCDLCDKQFDREITLKNHAKLHREPEQKCPFCPKLFHTEYYLKGNAFFYPNFMFGNNTTVCNSLILQHRFYLFSLVRRKDWSDRKIIHVIISLMMKYNDYLSVEL